MAVLAEAEIEPAAGETPSDFASRAEQELATTVGCDAPGLKEAAAVAEKIDYAGRGLGASDESSMRSAVDVFVRTVATRISFKRKIMAAWGKAPDVES